MTSGQSGRGKSPMGVKDVVSMMMYWTVELGTERLLSMLLDV
jgi:hypothetical protein